MREPEVAHRVALRGYVERRHEADALALRPGDIVLVKRGVLRSLVMACPDGCGERLTINLDERAGPAWRFYTRGLQVSLFPSVWRENGCGSHFILWADRILWCDRLEEPEDEPVALDRGLPASVLQRMTVDFRSYVDVAIELDQIPWEVARVCRRLVRNGQLMEGTAKLKGHFRVSDRRRSDSRKR